MRKTGVIMGDLVLYHCQLTAMLMWSQNQLTVQLEQLHPLQSPEQQLQEQGLILEMGDIEEDVGV